MTTEPNYGQVHGILRDVYGKAREHPCEDCGGPAHHWSYDGTGPTVSPDDGPYDPETYLLTYQPRCAKCHYKLDKIQGNGGIEAAIQRALATAPPITDAQRARVAQILGGAR